MVIAAHPLVASWSCGGRLAGISWHCHRRV
jgi:hypothetical protein